jgi:hypothetical protein
MIGVKMKKFLLAIIFMASWASLGAAKDIYIAQSATGSGSGSDCADALPWSAFSSSGNWVPGNTLHICGTYNIPVNGTGITAQGNGSSGNPITIFFEPGAMLTSAAMSMGININGHSFITVNGGPLISGALNGTIQNTANGYGLANHVSSPECVYNPGSNITVEYINCHNLYVTTPADSSGNDQGVGILVAANGIITHCSVDHVDLGVAAVNASNIEISYNSTSYNNHGITVGTSGGTVSNIKVHDNDVGGGGNIYDGAPGAYHRDALIVICEGSTNPCVTGLWIYSNYFHGVWSTESTSGMTADTFLDDYPSNEIEAFVFNNISAHDPPDTGTNNAYFEGGHAGFVYNNTVVATGSANGGACLGVFNSSSVQATVTENNVCSMVSYAVGFPKVGSGGGTLDYNDYFGARLWAASNGQDSTMPQMASDCAAEGGLGCDAHSSTANPNLNSDFTLPSTSPARGVGLNLTSLCSSVAPLCTGAPQTFGYNGACGTGCAARPPSGPWDLGAYPVSSSSVVRPNPPSALSATVN